jgi:hypothetical protein
VTHIYIKPSRATNAHYLTRSVRRTSGYVQTGQPDVVSAGLVDCSRQTRQCLLVPSRRAETVPFESKELTHLSNRENSG